MVNRVPAQKTYMIGADAYNGVADNHTRALSHAVRGRILRSGARTCQMIPSHGIHPSTEATLSTVCNAEGARKEAGAAKIALLTASSV